MVRERLCEVCEAPLGDERYCRSCGTLLKQHADLHDLGHVPEVEPTVGPAASRAELFVTCGRLAGSRYALTQRQAVVGRGPSVDWMLDDITVSRRHAQFTWRDDVLVVRDLNSLNGTYVNGERAAVAGVHAGDELRIGRFCLRLMEHPEAPIPR